MEINMINGVIFQKDHNGKYKGVEGYNWYLNDLYQELLGDYFDEYIDKSWYSSDYVDVCNEETFIKNYIALSQKEHIKFRILLCETARLYPKMEHNLYDARFIGYDYAYSGGSYYSAVLNDICSKRIKEFAGFSLNLHELFEKLEDINKFVEMRNQLVINSDKNLFEKGDFLIYKLYEIDTSKFIFS